MTSEDDIAARVRRRLQQFLESSGRTRIKITGNTNLISGLELCSEDGLDLVLDLCEEFDHEFPMDFNPLVHTDGKRGNQFNELVEQVRCHLTQSKATP